MNRLKPGDKARVKEYRFDISILTETETDPDELILSIIQAVKADGRSIAASPIPNPPNKDYPIQREPIEPVQEEESQKITLEELPAGSLFSFNGTIALKSEYRTENGAIEAFILGSGEMFWGGAFTAKEQTSLLVTPIRGIEELKRKA